jgi:cytoskeletal protein RodZ
MLLGSSRHYFFDTKFWRIFMRHLSAGFLVLLLSGAANAQTTVPNTFVAGTPAKAADVNADFQALVTAINNLATRVSKLEGKFTAADIAGTYAIAGLEVELGKESDTRAVIHNADSNASLTLNADGTFSLSSLSNNAKLIIDLNPPSGSPPINATTGSNNQTSSGTWALSGNTLTLTVTTSNLLLVVPPTVLTFINAAGTSLFIRAGHTTDGFDHSVYFLIRTN